MLNQSEKLNGAKIKSSDTVELRSLLGNSYLRELAGSGDWFSWSDKERLELESNLGRHATHLSPVGQKKSLKFQYRASCSNLQT